MRITNSMLTSNALNNINRNKANMSILGDQKSTGQKIQRPSEDPVVAVRSLKFRSNTTELTQYLSKNIPDAYAWMEVSEGAMTEINNLLEKMNGFCVQGSNDSYGTDNRETIVANLKQYREQIYSYGNSDYAGRYVFTGYRTDVPLLFKNSSQNVEYEITEPLRAEDIQQISHVTGGAAYAPGLTESDYAAMTPNTEHAYRLRLAYNENSSIQGISYTKKDGTPGVINPGDLQTVSVNDPDAYKATGNGIKFIKETGELILSDSRQKEMSEATNINVTYSKNSFKKEELRPEHYFDCKTYKLQQKVDAGGNPMVDADGNPIMERDATSETLYKRPKDQVIEYQVNFGQKLRVNTMANESITHAMGRDVDEILEQVNKVTAVEKKLADVTKRLGDETIKNDEVQQAALKKLKEQVEAELAQEKQILSGKFGAGITSTQTAQDGISASNADLGSRYLRLSMTESRLESQKVDFAEMQKNNDLVEMEDALINFESAKITYNASLSTASKIVQNTLLDFL